MDAKREISKELLEETYNSQNMSGSKIAAYFGVKLDMVKRMLKKFNDYPDLRFDINNGITLCETCHNKTKWKEEDFEQFFIDKIKI